MEAKKNWLKLTMVIVGALFLIGVSSAQAATVIIDPSNANNALGIRNLNVNGTHYNVDFLFDKATAEDIYGDPLVFDFSIETNAIDANSAVRTALNEEPVETVGPQNSDIYNIGYDTEGGVITPLRVITVQSEYSGSWGSAGAGAPEAIDFETYAKFNPIPLPAAVWLLGGGLIGLLGLRRRFKN